MQKKHIRVVVVVTLILVVLIAGWFWWRADRHKAVTKIKPTPVKLVVAKMMNLPVVANAIGNLVAPQNVTLKAQIAGQVSHIYFHEGQYVHASQPLVQLNDTTQQGALAKANATLWEMQGQFKRYQALSRQSQGFITKAQYDQAVSQYHQAQAAASIAKREISLMRITAPFDGTVGVAQVAVGSFLNVGDPIVTIVNRHDLEVSYTLPEQDFRLVKLGQAMQFTTRAYPNQTFHAVVSYIAPSVNQTTRSFEVRAKFDNDDDQLSPGMLVSVTHTLLAQQKMLVAPAISVVPLVDGFVVYRIKDNKVSQQHVTLGARHGKWVVITKGLKVGDRLIASGNAKAKLGATVQVVDS